MRVDDTWGNLDSFEARLLGIECGSDEHNSIE